MKEDDDHGDYISQLRAEFDSCDASASGFLERDQLTALCQKLHLEAHLQPLLDALLGHGGAGRVRARAGGCSGARAVAAEPCLGPQVSFEEFKEGFVAVLSRSLDLSTSEDDSSYLEPGNRRAAGAAAVARDNGFVPAVIPEEVKPKFVKGKKRYGRRSRPDKPQDALTRDPEGPSGMESSDLSPSGIRRAKLRRSTSLESIEVGQRPLVFEFCSYGCGKAAVPFVAGRGRHWTHVL